MQSEHSIQSAEEDENDEATPEQARAHAGFITNNCNGNRVYYRDLLRSSIFPVKEKGPTLTGRPYTK